MIISYCLNFILLVTSLLGIPFQKDRDLVLQEIKNKHLGTPNPDFRPSKRTVNFLDVELFGQYAPAMYTFFDKDQFYRLYFEFAVPANENKYFKELLADSIQSRIPDAQIKAPFYFVSKDGLHHIQITEDKAGVIILNDWYGPMWKPSSQQVVHSLLDAWEQYKKSK
jgi:hypothetical protein